MTEKIELEIDDLYADAVKQLKKEFGEKQAETLLSDQLQEAAKQLYDNRKQIKKTME